MNQNANSCFACTLAQVCYMFRLFQKTIGDCEGHLIRQRHDGNRQYGDGKSEINDIYITLANSCTLFRPPGR